MSAARETDRRLPRRVRLGLLAAAPLLGGLAVSLVWRLLAPGREVVATLALPAVPAAIGAVASALVVIVLLGQVPLRRAAAREHRRQLAEQEERHRRLLRRLDHELKNPVQGIRAAVADEPSEHQRASIDAQARRLTGLLGDLRRIGEVEHTALELTAVDLPALLEEAVAAVEDTPGGSARTLSLAVPRAPRPLPAVRADEDLLFLAVTNVLGNALKYSAPGDAVEVRARQDDDTVVLEIADTGRGIAPEHHDLVWEELGRAPDARDVPGSGLGLPMVRAILQRHGGAAHLESWPGEGSTVILRLPVAGPREDTGRRRRRP